MTNDELFTLIAGIRPNQMPKITEQSVEKMIRLQATSGYPLRALDVTETICLREEDRMNHWLFSGTTREGKSMAMIYQAMEDIRRGYCTVFIDPTDKGETAKFLLRWCVEQGHKKVLYIDPRAEFIPIINPLDPKNKARSINTLKTAFQLLFEVKDMSETPVVNDHLTSIINVLLDSKLPLFDSRYFTRFGNPYFTGIQQQILGELPGNEYAIDIEYHFKNQYLFDRFGSTTRRIRPILGEAIAPIFAERTGVDFKKLIAEKYTILVNLYPGDGLSEMEARFLGVIILLEMINAKEHLGGKVACFIDDAQRFLNRGVIDVLAHRQKSGFSMTLAHQYEKQFEDEFIRSGVMNLCKNFVMFHTPDYQTRLHLLERFFGSDAKDYANIQFSRQEALIKINKEDPQLMRVPDVKEPQVTNEEVIKFLYEHIYTQPYYQRPADVLAAARQRYADVTPIDNPSFKTRTKPYGKSTGKANKGQEEFDRRNSNKAREEKDNQEEEGIFPDWDSLFMENEGHEDSGG